MIPGGGQGFGVEAGAAPQVPQPAAGCHVPKDSGDGVRPQLLKEGVVAAGSIVIGRHRIEGDLGVREGIGCHNPYCNGSRYNPLRKSQIGPATGGASSSSMV